MSSGPGPYPNVWLTKESLAGNKARGPEDGPDPSRGPAGALWGPLPPLQPGMGPSGHTLPTLATAAHPHNPACTQKTQGHLPAPSTPQPIVSKDLPEGRPLPLCLQARALP